MSVFFKLDFTFFIRCVIKLKYFTEGFENTAANGDGLFGTFYINKSSIWRYNTMYKINADVC